MINEDNTSRYHRQQLIPNWEQEKLNSAKVLILGVGAIGSVVATNLAMSGVGELILVDFDTIEESNLNRQLLFHTSDIGKYKAEIAKLKLKLINPEIKITAFPHQMEKLPKNLLEGLTLIASCLDSFPGRRYANSLAFRERAPLVSGGMYAFLGNIQVVIPYETACFECQPLISQEKLSQACTPLGDARKNLVKEKEEVKIPSVATLSSIVGGLMSQEILKIILDFGNILNNYLFYDGLANSFTQLTLSRNTNCPICGEKYKLKQAEAIVFAGELVSTFKQRVAHAFGMANPTIMLKGIILNENEIMNCNDGDKLYIIDERLAGPISVNVVLKNK